MTGTYDHRDERLRRQAEEELLARPPLPPWQRRVLERFAVERRRGWYMLLNQFAPDTPEPRPDLVLVGPLGVFVVLLREAEPDWENSRAAFVWTAELLAGASTPRGLLTEAALTSVVVQPIDHRAPRHNGEHLVVTERDLDRILASGQQLLGPDEAFAAAAHLESRTFDLTPIGWHPDRIPQQRAVGGTIAASDSAGLFTAEELREEQLARALGGSFQNWRIFLDDTQLGMVRRHCNGPARITGPAGTGKTVLALHRLARLARRSTGELLFTTHLRNLPRIARRQFDTLAPQLRHRVEFTHLHSWAHDFLSARGFGTEPDTGEVGAAFQAVWDRLSPNSPLRQARPSRHYWKDEIDRVIKGRGIGTLESYRAVSRKGRGARLTSGFRPHVWEFYCEYERELSERGVYDHNDILSRALDELARHPLSRPYQAVVVDEVQDLTLVGLRLVHAISGDGPNQLMLIGDGQQQVYAGGWRLSEAGISLRGRGEVLRRNYRNRAAILAAASEADAVNRFDDLDGGPTVELRSALPVLGGGHTVRWRGTDQIAGLLAELRAFGDTSDIAVLTSTNRGVEQWSDTLRAAGFEVVRLKHWEGQPSGAIHVDTIHRAKGTEFRAVFLPDEHSSGELAHREERETLERRRLVAMSRARDYLWIGVLADLDSR